MGQAWIALTAALAIHVADEVANDFLDVWNPLVHQIRSRLPALPLPTFDFETWIGGLILGIIVLALLAPFAFRGRRSVRILSYFLAVVMIANGAGHLLASAYLGRFVAGSYSSPLLIATAVFLLHAARKSVPRSQE